MSRTGIRTGPSHRWRSPSRSPMAPLASGSQETAGVRFHRRRRCDGDRRGNSACNPRTWWVPPPPGGRHSACTPPHSKSEGKGRKCPKYTCCCPGPGPCNPSPWSRPRCCRSTSRTGIRRSPIHRWRLAVQRHRRPRGLRARRRRRGQEFTPVSRGSLDVISYGTHVCGSFQLSRRAGTPVPTPPRSNSGGQTAEVSQVHVSLPGPVPA